MREYHKEKISWYLSPGDRGGKIRAYLAALRGEVGPRIPVLNPPLPGDPERFEDRNNPELIAKASPLPRRPTDPRGILFLKNNYEILAVDENQNKLIGVYKTQPTILSGWCQKGVGARMAAEHDLAFPKISFASYTRLGLQNRLAAHALHVTWAILDGKTDIPQEVLDEYRVVNGKLRLAERIQGFHENPSLYPPAITIRKLYPSAAQGPVVPVPDQDEGPSP